VPLCVCPDCKREVSARAPACPHCGCPFEGADRSKLGQEIGSLRGCLWIVLIVLVGSVVAVLARIFTS